MGEIHNHNSMPQPSSDQYLDHLRVALEALDSGDRPAADAAIAPLATALPGRARRPAITGAQTVAIFRRDGFTYGDHDLESLHAFRGSVAKKDPFGTGLHQ